MAGESPSIVLYDMNGNPLAVQNGSVIAANTPGIISLGTDGTNSRYILVDATGRQVVVGSGTAGTPVGGVLTIQGISSGTVVPISGTVTANQGTSNTLANAWSTKLTDTTNGPVAVKPASTTATASDAALVVALSPNSATITVVNGAPTNSNAQITYGEITLSATTTNSVVEKTTYTEQSSNFTGSIKSASASDASAGTGARQIKITYVDATGATAGTETATLNGTIAVNLVTTTKCFIEKIEVISVGSGGSNVGIISLFTGANGTGTTVGTIAVGDNKTFWAHHYIVTGKTFNLAGVTVGSSQSVAGNGSSYVLKSISIGVANSVEKQINDTVTLFGQSSQVTRNYTTAIPTAVGPARVRAYVTTLGASSAIYRAAFDYYDQ